MKVLTSEVILGSEDKLHVIFLQGNGNSNLYDIKRSISTDWKSLSDLNLRVRFISYPILAEYYHGEILGKTRLRLKFLAIILIPILSLILLPLRLLFRIAIVLFLLLPILILMFEPTVNFHLNIEKSVTTVCAFVVKMLKEGIHPDNIFLFGNSIGGGIAAHVYHEFKLRGIHLKCIVSNSFSTLKRVMYSFVSAPLLRNVIKGIVFGFNMNLKPYKYITSVTPYTVYFNRKNDAIIPHEAQLRTKIMEKDGAEPIEGFEKQRIFLENHCLLICKYHVDYCPVIHNEPATHLVSDNAKPEKFLELVRYFIVESNNYTTTKSSNKEYDLSKLESCNWNEVEFVNIEELS